MELRGEACCSCHVGISCHTQHTHSSGTPAQPLPPVSPCMTLWHVTGGMCYMRAMNSLRD